jgi:hypothetical protein
LVVVGVVLASDPPDSAINPKSNNIEIADPVWAGSNQDIDYVVNTGSALQTQTVTDHSLDDREPRLVIASNGDAWVTWWRDDTEDKILIRKRHYSDGSWNDERVLSSSGESSHGSVIADDGSDRWVAYVFGNGTNASIAVSLVIDEPDPIGIRAVVATTTHSDPDVTIDAESGNLWVSWVDSSADVGWVEYDYTAESWSGASYESYAQDSVKHARDRIRDHVLGN